VETVEKCRIDKWLWAIRCYKTRSAASEAATSGKVKVDGQAVKASYMVTVGKTVAVRKGVVTYTYKVLGLIEKRVGAAVAREHYEDLTPPEELDKLKMDSLLPAAFRERGTGRPTKKERRDIDKFNRN
jgi:ribosome-associated heat shock protein Hsp15